MTLCPPENFILEIWQSSVKVDTIIAKLKNPSNFPVYNYKGYFAGHGNSSYNSYMIVLLA